MNNYLFNQQQNNNPYGFGFNTTYNQNQPKAKMTTGLTAEEMAELENMGAEKFNLNLTHEEELKCRCFHKKNGNIVLKERGDGYAECPICHEVFYVDPMSDEEVKAATSKMISILQMIKTYYLDCPENAAEFFYSIALISKVPKLYKIAMDDYQRHVHSNPLSYNNSQTNAFRLYDSLVSPASYFNGGYPGYMPQSGYTPQPGFIPQLGYVQPNQQGYVEPQQQGYMPQQGGGFMTSPNMMTQNATAVQPTQTVTPSTTVAGDTVQQGLK